MDKKVKSYKDLLVWQKSHQLALAIYKLSLNSKRNLANFDIWSQALRSAFSGPANIVEGYHSHKGKSFISYLEVSRASSKETEYWVLVLFETGNITKEEYESLAQGYCEVDLMLNSLIKKLKG